MVLSFNVLSTMLLAELPGGNLANYGVTGLFMFTVVTVGLFARKSIWVGAEWMLLMAWLLYAVVPAMLSQDVESSMFKVLTVLQLAVWALAIQQSILWRMGATAPLLMYGAAVTVAYAVSFAGIGVGVVEGSPDATGRVASTLVNANTFGAAAVMGLSLCLLAASGPLGPKAWLIQVVMALALVVAVVNSGSRTALVGMLFLLLGASWAFQFWRLKQFVRMFPSFLMIVVVASATYFVVKDMPVFADRVDSVFSLEDSNSMVSRLWDFIGVVGAGSLSAEEGGESMSQRFELVLVGLDLLLQSNLVGIGPDNFRSLIGAYSHSNVIEILVATGVVGILLYYSIYVALVWRCASILRVDRSHRVARMALVALATLSLMDIQHVSYDTKQGWLFLAILIGTVEVARRRALASRTASNKADKRTAEDSHAPEATGVMATPRLVSQTTLAPSTPIKLDTDRHVALKAIRPLKD
ncbi:MAG: O-antigen ligase family protein [Pseudomonadota bacterium]